MKPFPGEASLCSWLVAAFQAGLCVLFAQTCVPSLPEFLLPGPHCFAGPRTQTRLYRLWGTRRARGRAAVALGLL